MRTLPALALRRKPVRLVSIRNCQSLYGESQAFTLRPFFGEVSPDPSCPAVCGVKLTLVLSVRNRAGHPEKKQGPKSGPCFCSISVSFVGLLATYFHLDPISVPLSPAPRHYTPLKAGLTMRFMSDSVCRPNNGRHTPARP